MNGPLGKAHSPTDMTGMPKKRLGTAPERGSVDHPYRRDENILCAILALLKELDKNGLEFVVKDCNKRIAKMENF